MTDDKLGVIGQATVGTLSRTVTLTETTTNFASISLVQIDPGCSIVSIDCCDELTVTVTKPTPTPAPTCAERWPVSKVCTLGKGQSASNNAKLGHCLTGNIVDPSSIGATAHRIPVCRGTGVTAVVSDTSGTPTNSSDGSLSCTTTGCTGVVNVVEKYKSVSQDGKDTDRMTLLPN